MHFVFDDNDVDLVYVIFFNSYHYLWKGPLFKITQILYTIKEDKESK